MALNIEIPVSLGLLNALSQVADLRKMLLDSVNVKADAFKDILRFLDKIGGLADTLKGKMDEAFKTPSGSKAFLKSYELLFGMLEVARDKFASLEVDDLIFSSEESEKIEAYRSEISQLSLEIVNLRKGKVGHIFDDSDVEGAEKVREIIKNMGDSANNLTFNKLSSNINSELLSVTKQIDTTTEKLKALKTQVTAMSDNKFGELSGLILAAVTKAIDPSKTTFKNMALGQYSEALRDFYSDYSFYSGKTNFRTEGGVEAYLKKESSAIGLWADEAKQKIEEAQKVIELLNILRETAYKDDANYKTSDAKRNRANELLASLGLDIDPSKINVGANYREYIKNVITEINKLLEEDFGTNSTEAIEKIRLDMLNKLLHVFDNLDVDKKIDTKTLKNSLTTIFKDIGIKDSDIKDIFSGLSDKINMTPEAAFDTVIKQLENYKLKITESANASQEELDKLKAAEEALKLARSAVTTEEDDTDDKIKQNTEKIDENSQAIKRMAEEKKKANAEKIKPDGDGLEEGKTAIESYIDSLTKLEQKQKSLSNIQMAVNRWMGFWQVLNMTKSAINDMKLHIQELDTVMTSISVVTNFSLDDLWGLISKYSEIARQYGVAIKGVYEVSQIYYQLGLQLNDVMTLTTETLKMARIAGLDYATAADYMTTAIRGFKLEMTDAAHVTDVFSALAATTASSTEEIAVAISKTAASAEAVGASFEATSAMMATMISTTRESATNIGTALKSVISRYGEMTGDPSKTVDSEGEEMSLNRVDKALLTVGITIHDTAGLFRDFDDVMLELMEKWDSLDSLSLRYIATLMAGNRQQSRFLALVSNVDEYKKALLTAMDSEGTGELLTLKTLDSIDAKIEKMKVTIQEFYTSSGLEELYKNILDTITNIISAANTLPKAFGKIPVVALSMGFTLINTIKNIIQLIIQSIAAGLDSTRNLYTTFFNAIVQMASDTGERAGKIMADKMAEGAKEGTSQVSGSSLSKLSKLQTLGLRHASTFFNLLGSTLSIIGLTLYGNSKSLGEDYAAGGLTLGGSISSIAGGALSGLAMSGGNPVGAVLGGVTSLVSQVPSIISSVLMLSGGLEREIALKEKEVSSNKTEETRRKAEVTLLESVLTKLVELEATAGTSAEAMAEYKEYMNSVGASYPELISAISNTGDVTVTTTSVEIALANARVAAAEATEKALNSELEALELLIQAYEKLAEYANNTPVTIANLKNLIQYMKLSGAFDESLSTELNLINFYNYQIKNNPLFSARNFKTINPINNDYQSAYLMNESVIRGVLGRVVSTVNSGLGADNASEQQLRGMLATMIKNITTADVDISLGLLTGGIIKSSDDLAGLSIENVILTISNIKENVLKFIDLNNSALSLLEDNLSRALAMVSVLQVLSTQSADLSKYSNLFTNIIVGTSEENLDWSSVENLPLLTEYVNLLIEWVNSNGQAALNLLNLNVNEFKTERALTDYLTSLGLNEEFLKFFINSFTAQRKAAANALQNAGETIFGKDSQRVEDIINVFGYDRTDVQGERNINASQSKLNVNLASSLQKGLKAYSSMLQSGLTFTAENVYDAIMDSYEIISQYSQELLSVINDVILSIDFKDTDSLTNAATLLREYGPEYNELADRLELAAKLFIGNAALLLALVLDAMVETTKSIETVVDNSSKSFKFSEALEKANSIMATAPEDLTFSDLYVWDNEAKGYILTAKATLLSIDLTNSTLLKLLDDAETALKKSNGLFELNLESGNPGYTWNKLSEDKWENEWGKEAFQRAMGFEKDLIDSEEFLELYLLWKNLITEFNDSEYEDWDAFIEAKKQENEKLALGIKNARDTITKETVSSYLKSFDYTSIVSGKGTAQTKETLKALLVSAGGEHYASDIDLSFEDFYAHLIAGNIKEANNYLKHFGLSEFQVSEDQVNRARFEAFYDAYQKIAGDNSPLWSALDKETLDFLTKTAHITEADYTADPAAAALNLWAVIIEFIHNGTATFNEVAESISALSNQVYGNTSKEKSYQLLNKYKDGLTADELQALLGENDNLLINASTGQLSEKAAEYLTYDNGKFIAKAGLDAASVLAFLALILGYLIDTTTLEYKDTILEEVNNEITRLNNADIDKLRATLISALGNAKVGDRLNVSLLSSATQKHLTEAGLDITNGILTVTSEEALNNGILALKDKLTQGHWAERHSAEAREMESIVSTLESRMNKMTGLSDIISESVTKDAAEAFALAFEGTSEKAPEIMERMGAVWDNLSLTWIIDEDDLGEIESYIQDLEALDTTGANAKAISLMRALVENLRDSFARRPAQALNDILTNYTNVSNDMIATFDQYWLDKVDISEYIISIDEVTGNKKIDIVGLKQALIEAGAEVEELFNEVIAQVTNELLGLLSTGVNFLISGTNDFTEMLNFVDNINEKLESDFTIDDLFSYNTALDSFTLDTTAFNNYKKALEKELLDLHWSLDLIDEYIKDLTDGIILQSIELDSFLNADTNESRNDEANKLILLIRGLSNYAKIATSAFGSYDKQYKALLGKTVEEIQVIEALTILHVLESGGLDAVNLLKQIKPNASSDELEAAFNSQINKLNDVMNQVSDLVTGLFVGTEGKLHDVLARAGAVDSNGVVKAGFDMVDIYAAIYAKMEETAGHTVSDLNSAYVKLLTANSKNNTDALETLENASGMTYEAFGQLMDSYGLNMREVMMNPNVFGEIIDDGFGNIVITNFEKFVLGMNSTANANWDINDPRMAEAYNDYIDSLIEIKNLPMQMFLNNADLLKGLTEAKAGTAVNVSYLAKALGENASKVFSKYGTLLENGILELSDTADIPSLIADVANEAAKAGLLLPEQIAELNDAIEDALSLITSLITGGIDGNLSHSDAEKLNLWYKNLLIEAGISPNLVKELDFTRTTDGLRLATDSAKELYSTINQIDGIQGRIIFDGLKESLIETNDLFKTVLDTTAAIKKRAETIKAVSREYLTLAGNVQLYRHARHQISGELMIDAGWTDFNKDDYATLYSSTYSGDEYDKNIVLNITPITNDGKTILGPEDLDAYVSELMEKSSSAEEIMLNDNKHLVMGAWDVDVKNAEKLAEGLEVASSEADRLHLESAAIANNLDALDTTSDARINLYKEELELAEKINLVRSGTEDDSFKFMESDIPSGQNNPLNYWKNWATAFDAMKEAGTAAGEARNTMAYEDFYNIVTEMGNLAEISGQAVHLGENTLNNSQEAADLITRAAGALKNVDGELVVDLSSINVDFTSGLEDLGTEIDGQVDALADALIHMLDSVIAVLEVIVAMEDLKNLDVDDDLTLTLPEMGFKEDTDGKLKLTDTRLLKTVDSLLNIKATMDDGTSILDAVTLSTGEMEVSLREFLDNYNNTEWLFEHGIDANLFETLFSNMLKLVSSDDYDDLINTIQGFLDLWTNLDWGLWSFKVNSGEHTLNLTDDGTYSIDWLYANYDDLKKQVPEYLNMSNEEIRKAIEDAEKDDLKKYDTLTLETKKNIKILNRNIISKKDEEGNATGEWYVSGHPSKAYDSPEQAAVAEDLYAVGAENVKIELKGKEITAIGTVSIGKFQLDVKSDGKLVKYKGPDGNYYTERNDAIEAYYRNDREINKGDTVNLDSADFKAWQVEVGISVETIYSLNGENSDINNDEKLRDAVRNYLSGKTNATNLEWTEHAVTVKLEQGVKITIPTDGVELDKNNANEVNEFVNKSLSKDLNIDLLLADTITKGITNALPSLTDALSKLDAGPAQDVASAIKEIGDNAGTTLTSVSSLVDKIKELHELNGSEAKGKTSASPSESSTPRKSKIDELQEKGGIIVASAGTSDIPLTTVPVEADVTSAKEALENLKKEPVEIPIQLGSDELINSATQIGQSVADSLAEGILSGESNVKNAVGSIMTHITELGDTATVILNTIKDLLAGLLQHVSITGDVEFKTPSGNISGKSGVRGENGKINITVEGQDLIQEVKDEAAEPIKMTIDATADPAISVLNELIAKIKSTSVEASVNLSSLPSQIQSQIDSRTYTANVQLQSMGGLFTGGVALIATGNIGLAKAKGTLMGELGPELVVSNGRYFVAGLNGAEMVNLADDAIVFNHLQTEQLLKHGMSSGRGKAVTSEKNAVAFATGNTGPAMASASAALNALKQLRAMWESLRGASVSDLAGAGGGGGGGGGGDKAVDPSIWIDTVERWYNLMQKIAKLEKEITHEETLRSKLESDWNANGNHYYASQKRSLEALRDLIDAQEQLNLSRLAYYDLRVEALEKSPFGKLIRFDDEGQMFFLEGAMEWLTKLAGFDSEGKANYTDEEKYDILMKAGYGDYMKYDSDGGEIKKDSDGDGEVTDDELQTFYGNATKAFWDRIDDYKETTLSLWDSIKDGEDSLLDLQADLNSLLEEIRENQMEVEDLVLKAIEDLRQREIDALQDERDKLEESTLKYIDGLTDALNREQEMYLNLEDETNLNQQRRRLAILQRSGGSAEDIASLRSEIDSSERERYFNLQQQQIDAILAASDLEIERMDSLIEIMTETLEYQKEYGLLWGNVYAVMQESADKIVSFITNGNSEFWALSPLGTADNVNKTLFKAELWESYRKDLTAVKTSIDGDGTSGGIKENVALMVTMTREQMKDNDYKTFDEAMKKEFGNDYDKNGTYKDLFYSEYQEHGDLTKVTASARKKYSDDKKAAEATKKAVETTKPSTTTATTSSSDSSGDSDSSSDNHKLKRAPYWVSDGSSGCHQVAEYTDGTLKGATLPHNLVNGKCSRCGWASPKTNSIAEFVTGSNDPETVLAAGKGPLNTTPGSAEPWINQVKINTTKVELPAPNDLLANPLLRKIGTGKKASGGYVNHGVYELGELGTETVLTASQTKVLRDNILSNRPNSLISLLRSYNENYDGINSSLTGITPVEDNSVTIERVEMTMEVKQIANDYDAKRAGEQALNEMMRIARKTGATNSIRR